MMKTFFFQDEISWQSAGDRIKRQILGYDDHVMLVKVEFQVDAVGSEHSHPHTQSTYVAKGVFEFTVDGVTKVVKEGDGVYIASNVVHGVKCIEPGILIDAFNPMRKDFI